MDFQWHIGGDGFFGAFPRYLQFFPKRIVSLNHGKTLIEPPQKKTQDPTTPGFAQGKPLLEMLPQIFSKKYRNPLPPKTRLQPFNLPSTVTVCVIAAVPKHARECWMIWMAIGLHFTSKWTGLRALPPVHKSRQRSRSNCFDPGGGFEDFWTFSPRSLGKWSNLTSTFFRWVEITN